MEQRYLTEKQVSRIIGLSLSTLRNNRSMRTGINYHKIGRSVRYALQDVIDFVNQRKITIDGTNDHNLKGGPHATSNKNQR